MYFEDLHQEIIRDHYKNPRNKKLLPSVRGYENPSCGDSVRIEVDAEKSCIKAVYFDGDGCSLSMCSASMMSDLLCGRTCQQARQLIKEFLAIFQGELPAERLDDWGDLMVLKGVIQFPVRIKCVTLAWHAVERALDQLSCH